MSVNRFSNQLDVLTAGISSSFKDGVMIKSVSYEVLMGYVY